MAEIARSVVCLALALAAATSCDGDQDSTEPAPPASSPNDTTASPTESTEPAPATSRSTAPEKEDEDTCPRRETAAIGDCVEVDIFDGAIYLGEEIFIASPPIVAYPGRRWERSDLPTDWTVEILNQAPEDGNDWIIRSVHAERTGERTLEVTEPITGDRVGTFVRDETPPEERGIPG